MAAEYFSSDFEPFGVFEFSDDEPVTQKLYESMREQLGEAFQQPDQDAETFADAMCLGIAQLQIEAAAAQNDPQQISYLLAEVERDYRIVPPHDATLAERRDALEAAMTAAHGALTTVIFTGLTSILGDDFVYWRPTDLLTEVTPSTSAPVLVSAKTAIKLVQLAGPILPGTRTVAYTRVLDDGNPLMTNERIFVEPHNLGLDELVTISAVLTSPNRITATFTKVHENGTYATTAPVSRWVSTKCHSLVVVTSSVLSNATQLAQIHRFMRKAMPVSNTWAICSETGTGVVGPFQVGIGRIGQTPISTTVIDTEL